MIQFAIEPHEQVATMTYSNIGTAFTLNIQMDKPEQIV